MSYVAATRTALLERFGLLWHFGDRLNLAKLTRETNPTT